LPGKTAGLPGDGRGLGIPEKKEPQHFCLNIQFVMVIFINMEAWIKASVIS
jgi:hypothetical protein